MNISVHIIFCHDNHFSVFLCLCRYAYPGEPAAGHSAHAGKCASALFLCLLHFWHHWRAAMGWTIKKSLLPRGELHPVSTKRGGLVGLREWEREKTECTECFYYNLVEEKKHWIQTVGLFGWQFRFTKDEEIEFRKPDLLEDAFRSTWSVHHWIGLIFQMSLLSKKGYLMWSMDILGLHGPWGPINK